MKTVIFAILALTVSNFICAFEGPKQEAKAIYGRKFVDGSVITYDGDLGSLMCRVRCHDGHTYTGELAEWTKDEVGNNRISSKVLAPDKAKQHFLELLAQDPDQKQK